MQGGQREKVKQLGYPRRHREHHDVYRVELGHDEKRKQHRTKHDEDTMKEAESQRIGTQLLHVICSIMP